MSHDPHDPLITTAGLHDLLGSERPPTVLDVRWRLGGPPGRAEHEAGHVPGAAYVDLETALAGPPGSGGRHPLPEPEVFQAAMRAAGVDDDRPVVVLDDWSGHAAARAWWLLRHHGHRDVRVLDGGWTAWVADGGEVETGPVTPTPGTFTARAGRQPVVEADALRDVAVVLDARAPARFRGDEEPVDPVAGHVPGARNVPSTANLGADGRFLDADRLRALYAAAGADGSAPVAVYCGSGVTAAHDVLALTRAGITAALHPGSWSEWVTDPARPVARTAREDDVAGLVALAERVWPVAYSFDPELARTTLETWWTPEATTTSLASTTWRVVERDGRLVAAGNLDLRPDRPVVWKLLVDPDEQGDGLGTAVLEELAVLAGPRGLRLSHAERNDAAARFYAARGFVEVGRGGGEVVLERVPGC